jgi:peroxiredoxin
MNVRNILPWLVLMAGALVITYTWAPGRGQRELIAPEKRAAAAEFQLQDSTGEAVKLSDYQGKVVLLNFWATWCGPCEVEIPWFAEFEKTYKDRGFAVVGVSTDDAGWDTIRGYMTAHKINYRVVLDDGKMLEPYKGIQAIPTTYLVDQQGRIAVVHTGLVAKDTYVAGIEKLLTP